jgi:DNA-binding PadR family transcriptional regulator
MVRVSAPVTTKVALLQALRDGPAYGKELIRRLRAMTESGLRPSPARVYPALKVLARDGLLSRRQVSPRGARGARSRVYYELTSRGLAVSTEQRRVLASIVRRLAPPAPDAAERARMAERLGEAEELAELGADLERAMRGGR